MGNNPRRRRRRQGSDAAPPVTDEVAIQVLTKDEGGSAARQPGAVPTAEADGHLVGASGACGGGGATGEDDDRPRAATTASKEDGHLGVEGGVGASAGLPRAVLTALAEGHGGSAVIDGQLRAVEIALEGEGSTAVDSAGGGAPGHCGGDHVLDAWKNGSFLLEAVLKWKVADIFNTDLLKNKVSPHELAVYSSAYV